MCEKSIVKSIIFYPDDLNLPTDIKDTLDTLLFLFEKYKIDFDFKTKVSLYSNFKEDRDEKHE